MEKFETIILYAILHAMKVGTCICILILLCATKSMDNLFPDNNWFYNFIAFSLIITFFKFIFGGWSATSLKWMTWSCILSTIGGIGLSILGMASAHQNISFWICCIPVVIPAIFGIWAANYIENILTEEISANMSPEGIVGSIFDNGLRNTLNSFIGKYEMNTYYAYGRGVAVYSNLTIIIGLIIFLIYR